MKKQQQLLPLPLLQCRGVKQPIANEISIQLYRLPVLTPDYHDSDKAFVCIEKANRQLFVVFHFLLFFLVWNSVTSIYMVLQKWHSGVWES